MNEGEVLIIAVQSDGTLAVATDDEGQPIVYATPLEAQAVLDSWNAIPIEGAGPWHIAQIRIIKEDE